MKSPKTKSPRRKSSYSTSLAQEDFTMDPTSRRRSSFVTSWADDDDDALTTTRAARRRQYSWGPVGEAGFRDSIRSASSRSPVSHHECKLDFRLVCINPHALFTIPAIHLFNDWLCKYLHDRPVEWIVTIDV